AAAASGGPERARNIESIGRGRSGGNPGKGPGDAEAHECLERRQPRRGPSVQTKNLTRRERRVAEFCAGECPVFYRRWGTRRFSTRLRLERVYCIKRNRKSNITAGTNR